MNEAETNLLELSQKCRSLNHAKHNALQRIGKARRLYESSQRNLTIAAERVESANQEYESICSQLKELSPFYNAASRSANKRLEPSSD